MPRSYAKKPKRRSEGQQLSLIAARESRAQHQDVKKGLGTEASARKDRFQQEYREKQVTLYAWKVKQATVGYWNERRRCRRKEKAEAARKLELKRLKKENQRLMMENDRLKKDAARTEEDITRVLEDFSTRPQIADRRER